MKHPQLEFCNGEKAVLFFKQRMSARGLLEVTTLLSKARDGNNLERSTV